MNKSIIIFLCVFKEGAVLKYMTKMTYVVGGN